MKLTITKRFSVLSFAAVLGVAAVAITPQFLAAPASADAINNTDFVMTVDTSASAGAPRTFVIPTIGAGHNYNYTVDCNNDGVLEATGLTGNYTCTYDNPGVYTIRIGGSFSRIYFNNRGDRLKVRSIDQWGTGKWTSMERAFYGVSKMDVKATDTPDLSRANNLAYMFAGAESLKGDTANWNWNTGTVTNLDSAFLGANKFNRSLNWDTSRVTNLNNVLSEAAAYNQSLSHWDVKNVTTAVNALDNTGLSTANYDSTLSAWSSQDVRNNVILGVASLKYCGAADQRSKLVNEKQWTFSGDTKECQKFTVNFDSQSGTAVAGQSVTQSDAIAEPAAPTRDDYKFEGWFTDQNLTTAWNFASDRMPGHDMMLYAKWVPLLPSQVPTSPSQESPAPHGQQPESPAPAGQDQQRPAGSLADTGSAVWVLLAAGLGLFNAGTVILHKIRR